MQDGIYSNPTKILFGKTSLELLGEEVAKSARKVLVVYGGQTYFKLNLDKNIKNQFQKQNISYWELGGIKPNPLADKVYEGIALCREHDVQLVLAVGGGSVIDTAKAIAAGVNYEGDFFDFFERKCLPSKLMPVATVLTVVGAGSESSDGAVISKNDRKYSCGSPMMYPLFSILNPELTLSVPVYQSVCGLVDAISHVMERYFSSTTYVETSTAMCEALIRTLIHYGRLIINDPQNYEIRAEIMWAAKLAHDNTVGFGRKQDWATHAIAHEVGARYDAPHGATLAILFPSWMYYICLKHESLFVRFAKEVFYISSENKTNQEIAHEGIAAYQKFVETLGLPTNLRELGLTDTTEFLAIADACSLTTKSGTIGNLQRLTKTDVIEILKLSA